MDRITYQDFDLKISATGDGYTAVVQRSPGGEGQASFTLPFSPIELENLILRMTRMRSARRKDSPEMEAARSLGAGLFQAVFQGAVGKCLSKSQEKISEQSGLRIKLRLQEAPGLSELPWEFLFDKDEGRFLAQSVYTPIVRYLEFGGSIPPLKVNLPLHILGVVATPSDYRPPLNVKDEQRRLEAALGELIKGDMVKITWLEQATLDNLRRALRAGAYHVFHFIGHGGFDRRSERGVLVFVNEDGRSQEVDAERLGVLLHDHRSLRLAVLNACEGARSTADDPFAGVATNLVRQGIPAVVAMQFEISDPSARAFAGEFYAALAQGYPVDAALAEARKAVYCLPEDVEWGTPVLYLRSPDGVLFDVAVPPAKVEVASEPKPVETTKTAVNEAAIGKTQETKQPPLEKLATSKQEKSTPADELGMVLPADLYAFEYLADSRVWISKYLVTNEQYRRFLEAEDYAAQRFWVGFPRYGPPPKCDLQGDWGEEGWRWLLANFKGKVPMAEKMRVEPRFWRSPKLGIKRPGLPVVGVTWYEAYAYCQWLQEHWTECEEAQQNPSLPSFTLRLPLEAELKEITDGSMAVARYVADEAGDAQIDIASLLRQQATMQPLNGHTTMVNWELSGDDSLEGLGLAGITWEWLANIYKQNNRDRVVRMAGWVSGQLHIQSTSRYANPPVHFADSLGFRVVYQPTLVDEATVQEALRAENLKASGAIVELAEVRQALEPTAQEQSATSTDPEKVLPSDLYTFVYLPQVKGWIGKYPVTNLQYQRFLEYPDFARQDFWVRFPKYEEPPGCKLLGDWGNAGWEWLQSALKDKEYSPDGKHLEPRYWRDSKFGLQRPGVPVVGVSWYEANAYCKWLQVHWAGLKERIDNPGLSLKVLRLPTEQEWITAAGGANPERRFPWDRGGQVTEKIEEVVRRANVTESGIGHTTLVGMYPRGQSPAGVWDLAGNVWEWQANYYDKDRDGLALRGGSFDLDADGARLSARDGYRPSVDWFNFGFRVFVSPS